MTDERKRDDADLASGTPSRRTLLRLGAIAAPAVVTLRPAWASGGHNGGGGWGGGATTSVSVCRIPVDKVCDADGKSYDDYSYDYGSYGGNDKGKGKGKGKGKDDDKPECYAPPPNGYYLGQELVDYEKYGRVPDGVQVKQFEAHLKYIKNNVVNKKGAGFTCIASLTIKLT